MNAQAAAVGNTRSSSVAIAASNSRAIDAKYGAEVGENTVTTWSGRGGVTSAPGGPFRVASLRGLIPPASSRSCWRGAECALPSWQ